MEIENYCARIRHGILQYCHHLPHNKNSDASSSLSGTSSLPPASQQHQSSLSDPFATEDSILSILVGDSLEWCKYEAFCYGFEEILSHEKLYSEQEQRYEELRRKYEELQQKNDENLQEIKRLKHLLATSETTKNHSIRHQRRSPFHPLTNSLNQENKTKFPEINLNEM